MKKVFSLMLVASMFAIVACGPSAEDKAAAEKATQDSIAVAEEAQQAAAEQAVMQDSVMNAMESAVDTAKAQ